MKNVFLIGDSIRFGSGDVSPGYGVYVKEKLEGRANVYAPDENCRFAQYTLRYLHEWVEKCGVDGKSIDVVHWNNGLWDVLRLFGEEPFTPVDMYVEMLRRVHKRIRMLFPNARVIFALNTAVIEDMSKPEFTRRNADIERYNAAALALMEELGVEVNDLYAVTKNMGREMHADWVHYNEEGSRILAEKVIETVMR